MKLLAVAALAAIATVPCAAQATGAAGRSLSIPGTLALVDQPPSATPVELLTITIQSAGGGPRFDAQPDHDGKFTLQNVPPRRYALLVPTACRVRVFALDSQSLMPDDFALQAGESRPLRIVASLKTAVLSVSISGIPEPHPALVSVLYPGDPYLMPPNSGIGNPISGDQTQYRSLTPGRYTLFVADEDFRWALTSAEVRDALKDKATAVQVRDDGETRVSTTYLSPDAVRQAIAAANWKDPREMFRKRP